MNRERTATGPGRSMQRMLVAGAVLLVTGTAGAFAAPPADASGVHGQAAKPVRTAPPLDLNSASKAELKKLPWIGEAEADRIIAARPYFSKTDIVTRAGIPIGIYQAIRRQIAVVPKTMPNPRG